MRFNTSSPDTFGVIQSSDKAIVNWTTFDVANGFSVNIAQPGQTSAMLARVTGNTDTRIAGNLTANGQVVLVNPNGIAIGAGGAINAGSFTASTLDIADADFLSGNLVFRRTGQARSVLNAGNITASGGDVALLGSAAVNEGVVAARLGRVALAAGDAITLDFSGDNFLRIAVPVSEAAGITDALGRPLDALVMAGGQVKAEGGRIYLSAASARQLMMGAVKVDGEMIATTARAENGRISLGGINVDGGNGLVQLNGKLDASGGAGLDGGSVTVSGGAVGVGGVITASGGRNGGAVDVTASRTLSIAAEVDAIGFRGTGGAINYTSAGNISENVHGATDASGGIIGGSITVLAAGDLATSGAYRANGLLGLGGRIDMTGSSVRLLSTNLTARGFQQGGLIRIGGAFQGGAADRTSRADFQAFEGRFGALPTLANAQTTFVNDGVTIDASAIRGAGGTAVIWSDETTTMLGALRADGQRAGGYAEVSGKETLRYVDLSRIDTGVGGKLLLDPKNIVIGDFAEASSWQYAAVVGAGITRFDINLGTGLKLNSRFGASVALNGAGDRLAVGAPFENSFDDLVSSTGSVRLFTFANSNYGGGALVGTIGRGYSGSGNLDLGSLLNAGVEFGSSVALNAAGDRLAVGARNDDGPGGSANQYGAVHLFTFANTSFGGAARASTIGRGYTGPNDIDLGGSLRGEDRFGSSVSLNAAGDRLAVGAPEDRGSLINVPFAGAVRLFTFTNTSFGGGALAGTIGRGLRGNPQPAPTGGGGEGGEGGPPPPPPPPPLPPPPGDFDLTTLDEFDFFGSSVALNAAGDRLAVGSRGDSGATNSVAGAGSVRLFSFADNNFSQTTLVGTIGQGYSGPKDVDLADLEEGDAFGSALAFNAAGDRLVVGVGSDDGFSNLAQDSGSVRLFTFDDANFSNGTQVGTIGTGYTGVKDVNVANNVGNGADLSVALNAAGDRLAVGGGGLPGPDPFGGAVRLFSFGDTSFSGGMLRGVIGRGFTGSDNIDLSALLASGDDFGASVALNAAGNRLAVGAPGDDGFANTTANSGAVRLFTFSNTSFGGGVLAGTIGRGYTGTGNLDLGSELESEDNFGRSVALNAAGDLLAVGATGDDGFGNGTADSGSVRLFNFQTTSFGGPSLAATIGRGYAGARDLDLGVSLASDDKFGTSVAFNALGDRLAVGATGDDGADNSLSDSGAVWLFNTTGILSNSASLLGRIGRGYTGANSIDLGLAVRAGDNFGTSVALNGAGNRLVVGATGYDGFTNTVEDSGSVALFGFADNNFSLGGRLAMIANGWTGPNNLNLDLEDFDNFGQSVALSADGTRVAAGVGIYYGVRLFDYAGNGSGGVTSAGTVDIELGQNVYLGQAVAMNASGDSLALGTPDANRVFLLTRGGGGQAPSPLAFGDNAAGTSNISAARLAFFLSTGQSISLEASNDITLLSALTVNNPVGNGGGLTLRAGRSILLNADITTDDGNLTLEANTGGSDLSTVNANRDPGAAEITMAAGTSINAGFSGAVSMRLFPGTGLTTPTSGDITLGSITANSIAVSNAGPTSGSDIIVRSGSTLRARGSGPSGVFGVRRGISIRAETGTFINNAGAGLFDLSQAPGATYSVFSDAPATTLEGVTGYLKRYNVADAAAFAALNPAGNFFGYRIAPVLTVTANNASRVYGASNPVFSSTITGFIDGDTAADVFGIASLTNSAVRATGVGTYTIVAGLGSLESSQGYQFVTANGSLSITPRPITVTALAASRVYGAPTFLGFTVGGMGLVNNDFLIDSLATTATAASGVGTYAITQGTLRANSNYELTFVGANLTITPRPITITANPASRIYGDATAPNLTYTVGGLGLVNNDFLFGSLRSNANQVSSVGNYAITQGTLQAGANYEITSFTGGNLTVAPRPITVTANALSRIYGNSNPALTYVVGGQGLVNNDTLSGALTTAATTASSVGNYGITLGTLANSNYQIAYTGANLTVTPRPITVTADLFQSRFYGSANPQLTYTVGGSGLVNGDTLSGALTSAANATSNVGFYDITQGTLGNSNYAITYNGQLLRVAPRPITVTANALSRVFGNENPELTYTVGGQGLVNNDTLSGRLSTSADRFTNIGAALITQGTLAANSNYALTYVGANLTITPRPISITANPITRQFGDPNPSILGFTAGGLGLVAWDPAQGALATSANTFSNVGSYDITQGTLRFSSNYVLTSFTGATLTIVPRELTVTVLGTSRIYGDPNRLSFQVGGRGLVNGDTLSGALTSAANERSNVGSYAISNTLSASSNYVITNFFGGNTLFVSPRPIEVIADSYTKIAGTPDPAFTVTTLLTGRGLVNGDTLAAGQLSRDPGELPGSYTIRLGSLSNPNYAIFFQPGLLRIVQAPLPPAASGASTPPPAAQGASGTGQVNSGPSSAYRTFTIRDFTGALLSVKALEAVADGYNMFDSTRRESAPDDDEVKEDVRNAVVGIVKKAVDRLQLWPW